ncbi:hypothetical protein LBMAG56_52370 [Verrucomicrobiota bacterium]|nr:hypothetical protein LBMAG56_52370 [Verrucomicrobiota bacterium]
MQTEEQHLIRRIADYERLSCIFWFVLGVIQICMLWTAIAGVWNIIASITRWKLPDRIRQQDPTIPKTYESITQLVIVGIVNVVLGGFIGVIFIAFDFYIRDKVLTNSHLFTGVVQPSADTSSLIPIPVPVAASGFDHQLRTLAKLRDDGVITEEDFGRKKKQILGL